VNPTRRTQPKVRYRVTVTEPIDDTATVVMDATGSGSTLPSATWSMPIYAPSMASAGRPTCWSTSPSSSQTTPPAPTTQPANAIPKN
jgi:hypothetical protein